MKIIENGGQVTDFTNWRAKRFKTPEDWGVKQGNNQPAEGGNAPVSLLARLRKPTTPEMQKIQSLPNNIIDLEGWKKKNGK